MPLHRIIPIEDLPKSLWDGRTLHLPASLVAAYRDAIARHGLQTLAGSRDPKNPPVGGVTVQDARKHFAQAFDGSCARSALALLDPKGEVQRVADGLASVFAGGRIAVLDTPCGAGAFFVSTLTAIAELRERGVVPRQPLEVVVLGGDINQHATTYASELVSTLSDILARQSIFVEFQCERWDVLRDTSTARLLKNFVVKADRCGRTVVVISNFSGFLRSSANWKAAEPQLKSMFLFCAGSRSSALWLEPQTNAATIALRERVVAVIKKKWSEFMGFFGSVHDGEEQEKTQVSFALPLDPAVACKARLAVMRFDLRSPQQ